MTNAGTADAQNAVEITFCEKGTTFTALKNSRLPITAIAQNSASKPSAP